MHYSEPLLDKLANEYPVIVGELQDLRLRTLLQSERMTNPRVIDHLKFGALRRVAVLERAIENIFALFPPNTDRPLLPDALSDVQINLHAFVMNLFGVFDNWAWAFVLRHGLEAAVGGRRNVGIFNEATKRHLPASLRTYVSNPEMIKWYEQYLRNYRDALAHRIPLYIPPKEMTPEEGEHFQRLDRESVDALKRGDLEGHKKALSDKNALGRPSFVFLHSFSDSDKSEPLMLHPQVLSDARTVAEFGLKFLETWHERT